MFDVSARLMRCCKSQNRKHNRDATGYDEHQNALVCKKHCVHDGLQTERQMPYQPRWKERVPVRLLRWLLHTFLTGRFEKVSASITYHSLSEYSAHHG